MEPTITIDPPGAFARAPADPLGAEVGLVVAEPPLPAEPPPPAAPPFPPPLAFAAGVSGYLVLGAAFGLGLAAPDDPYGPPAWLGGVVVPSLLLGLVGAVAFTLPALLVVHQSLRYAASPSALLGATAWNVVRIGRVALALTPLALLYAAAGTVVAALLATTFVALGLLGLWTGARALLDTEAAAGNTGGEGLVGAWAGLTGVAGLALFVSWVAWFAPVPA